MKANKKTLETNKQFYGEVRNSLKNYTISSKEGGIWVLSYILIPEGIKDISERKDGREY